MTAWRRLLLAHQISELTTTKLAAFNEAGAISYVTPASVQVLIRKANAAWAAGRLDRAERCCIAAEKGLIRHRRKFWAALAARHSSAPSSSAEVV
jgi:hypothetical protein